METLQLSDIGALREWLQRERKVLNRRVGEAQAIARRGKQAKAFHSAALARADEAEQAAVLLGQFADERQVRVMGAIESVVSAGLTSVFGEEVELKLTQTTRARRVEVDVTVKTGDLETPILEARGGGLAAAAGFLLRATTLLLTRGARRLLVADESFAHMSADYTPRMADFIAELCKTTGLQVILVTHDDNFVEASDRVIRLVRKGDATTAVVEK